jgi:hypothetical protein
MRRSGRPLDQRRDIMALNVYSIERSEKIRRGMGDFVEFLHSLGRIPKKVEPESVFYTRLSRRWTPRWSGRRRSVVLDDRRLSTPARCA